MIQKLLTSSIGAIFIILLSLISSLLVFLLMVFGLIYMHGGVSRVFSVGVDGVYSMNPNYANNATFLFVIFLSFVISILFGISIFTRFFQRNLMNNKTFNEARRKKIRLHFSYLIMSIVFSIYPLIGQDYIVFYIALLMVAYNFYWLLYFLFKEILNLFDLTFCENRQPRFSSFVG